MYQFSFLNSFSSHRPVFVSGGLVALVAVLLAAYALSATALMRADLSLQQKQNAITDAKEETTNLQIRFAEVGSLQQISERSASLSYTSAGQVYYIERASDTAVAVR